MSEQATASKRKRPSAFNGNWIAFVIRRQILFKSFSNLCSHEAYCYAMFAMNHSHRTFFVKPRRAKKNEMEEKWQQQQQQKWWHCNLSFNRKPKWYLIWKKSFKRYFLHLILFFLLFWNPPHNNCYSLSSPFFDLVLVSDAMEQIDILLCVKKKYNSQWACSELSIFAASSLCVCVCVCETYALIL